MKRNIQDLINGVYVWAGRPTRDGAKKLRDLASEVEEQVRKSAHLTMKVKKLYPDAKIPFKKDPADAGYDVFTHRVEDCGSYIKVFSGISIQPDVGYYCFLAPRSSSCKAGLTLYNNLGVIDNGYLGEIIGIFLKTKDFKELPKKDDRLMQLIPQIQIWAEIVEADELLPTDRGTGGFGSSGR